MMTATMLLATTLVAVDTGWQPTDEGGLEYIIQIDPQLFASLREGEAITSEIPPELGDVRRYRIMIGSTQLPRIDLPPKQAAIPPSSSTFPERIDPPPVLAIDPPAPKLNSEPRTFEAPRKPEMLASHVVTQKPASDNTSPTEKEKVKSDSAAQAPTQRWFPLTVVLLGLVGSLGANAFLGWMWIETRHRYHTLTRARAAAV
jgi:hypothetical protein